MSKRIPLSKVIGSRVAFGMVHRSIADIMTAMRSSFGLGRCLISSSSSTGTFASPVSSPGRAMSSVSPAGISKRQLCWGIRSCSFRQPSALGIPLKNCSCSYSTKTVKTKHSSSVEPVDDDDFGDQQHYFMDNTAIHRHNKKWLTKKNKVKKQSTSKVVATYKEIKDSTYDELIHTFPQLEDFDREEVKILMAEAIFYGLSPTKVAKILSRYPEFIQNYRELLPNASKAWRALGFSEKDRASFFHKHPSLMSISTDTLSKGYGFLSTYFSNKELVLLIRTNPRVIVENENVLKDKLDCLWKTYSHSTLAIAQSESISRTIDHVQIRHEFLIRAGLFKAIPHHKFLKMQAEADRRRIAMVRDRYFSPGIIVCSSDEKFLTECTQNNLTATELATFEEFLIQEKENNQFYESVERENELALTGDVNRSNLWSNDDNDIDTNKDESLKINSTSIGSDSFQEDLDASEVGDEDDEEEDTVVDYYDKRYYHRGGNSFELFNIVDSVDFYF